MLHCLILITQLTSKNEEYLKEEHAIYCVSYNHRVPQSEDDESDFRKHITTIRIKYEPKVDCTQEQIFK